MGYLNKEQLDSIGFGSIGENVLISDKCSIYNPSKIFLKSNIRIDDFSIVSAGEKGIAIGNYVHISCYVSLIGQELIKIGDYSGLSARVSIYSSSDDFSGEYLAGPTIPKEYTNVVSKPVIIGKFVTIGTGCVLLPGTKIESNSAFGAMSLGIEGYYFNDSIYAGVPANFIKNRKLKRKELEKKLNDNL